MLIDQINLNQLRVFKSVFENKSMTRAAAELHLTQSGISQHIKALEDMLEIKLFDRVRQRLVPTAPAVVLFERCEKNFNSFEEVLSDLKAGQKQLLGTVSIGMPIEFGNNLLMPLLSDFCKRHPHVDLKIRMGFASEMNDALLDGALDFSFVDTFRLDRRVFTQEVFEEVLHMIACKEYVRANEDKLAKKKGLEELDFIAYQEGAPVLKLWFKQKLNKTQVDLNVRARVMDVQGVARLVTSGLGCGVIPGYLVTQLRKDGHDLHVFDDGKKEVRNKIHLASLRGKSLIPAARELRDFLLESLKKPRPKV